MATGTKDALAQALRQMMTVKPIDKVTVKDIVEICGVNRQTFYYHFDDVDDLLEWVFEQDSDRVFPREVIYDRWLDNMMTYIDYLENNSTFTLNVYNSNSRLYMLRYLKEKMKHCIHDFAVIASEGKSISRENFDFVVEFYANCAIGFIAQWMDQGMQLSKEMTRERILRAMDQSVENLIARFVPISETTPNRKPMTAGEKGSYKRKY